MDKGDIVFDSGGKTLVTFRSDGTVLVVGNVDKAAKRFWDSVQVHCRRDAVLDKALVAKLIKEFVLSDASTSANRVQLKNQARELLKSLE